MKFTKIHGLGNDYIYIDARYHHIHNPNELSKILSNRHLGIGSDGLILLLNPSLQNTDFKMRIFNSDGTEAEMCGNGIRGLGLFIYDKHLSNKDTLLIETKAGVKELNLNIKNNQIDSISVDMGKIILDSKLIPINTNEKEFLNKNLKLDNTNILINCISLGNPHCVIFTDNLKDICLSKLGPMIENHHLFPNKTNVEFVKVIDKNNIMMRVWERGSGETLACGTGACASAVISFLNGKTNNICTVHLQEGTLNINYDTFTKHVFLSGSATKVFDGNINIKKLKKN